MNKFFAEATGLKPSRAITESPLEARVQDVFILVLGTSIVVATGFNGEFVHPHGSLVALCTGLLICGVALWGLGRPGHAIVPYLELLAGLLLACAPLYTRGVPLHYAECTAVGVLASAFALYAAILAYSRRRRAIL